MDFLYDFKKKCVLNLYFPKTGVFLIDELKDLLKNSSAENLKFLNEDKIASYMILSIENLKVEKLVKAAQKEARKDPILSAVFFDREQRARNASPPLLYRL